MNNIIWFIIKDVGKESYGAVVYDKDGKFLWASSMMPTKEQAKALLDDWTIKFENDTELSVISASLQRLEAIEKRAEEVLGKELTKAERNFIDFIIKGADQ